MTKFESTILNLISEKPQTTIEISEKVKTKLQSQRRFFDQGDITSAIQRLKKAGHINRDWNDFGESIFTR